MNSLSWMIYAAEVLTNAGVVALILAVVSIFLWVMAAGVTGGMGYVDDYESSRVQFRWVMRRFWIPLTFLIVSILLPSQKTIYMIAASEAGETIITNPDAKEVFNDLTAIIKSKLKEQLPKP